MSIPAHVKYIVMSLLLIIASVNFARTTVDIVDSSKRLDSLNSEVSILEAKKETLEKDLEHRKTAAYIEEEARNRLNLVKPGEMVFIKPAVLAKSTITENMPNKMDVSPGMSNFRLWLNLFF